MTQDTELREHLFVVVGILLIVGLNVAVLIIGGTVIYETTAPNNTETEMPSSDLASVSFEHTTDDAGHLAVTATLVEVSETAVEVRLVVDSATGSETERWTKPSSDVRYDEHRTVGDEFDTGLHPGDIILLRVSDGETTRTLQEYTIMG